MLLMQLACAILLGSDAAAWAFRGSPGVFSRCIVSVSNFLVFAFSDILLLLYHRYICSYLFGDESQKNRNIRRKLVEIIGIAAIFLVILSQFTHLYYYIDSRNYYHRNPAYIISVLLPMTGMLLDLSLLIEYRKRISRELLVAMISYIVLPFAAAAAQIFYILTRQESGFIRIEVVDDGAGFAPEDLDKENSVGIRNIRYRLEHMANAELQIDSAPEQGTRAVIRILTADSKTEKG